MSRPISLTALPLMLAFAGLSFSQERVPEIPVSDFDRLHATITPQKGESPWREVAWVTNISEARRRGVAEDKPLVIFTAADGSPLART